MLNVNLNQTKHLSPISARNMCMISAWLSLFCCLTAQWATFNIAVYSFQAMSEFCSRCCCSLVHKRNLVITIICQVLINVVIIVIYTIVYDKYANYSDLNDLFDLQLHDYDKNTDNDFFPTGVEVLIHSRLERIGQIFGRCAWAQSNGFGNCLANTVDNHTTIINDSNCQFLFGYGFLEATLMGST